jgi:hypothetical protein
MVQGFLDEKPDYPVGVEYEICPVGLDISYLAVKVLGSEVADGVLDFFFENVEIRET